MGKLQLPRCRLHCQEIPHGYQVWEEVTGGRSFSWESEWIEATPGGRRLPGEEWNKQLEFLLGSKWRIWTPATLVTTSNRPYQKDYISTVSSNMLVTPGPSNVHDISAAHTSWDALFIRGGNFLCIKTLQKIKIQLRHIINLVNYKLQQNPRDVTCNMN